MTVGTTSGGTSTTRSDSLHSRQPCRSRMEAGDLRVFRTMAILMLGGAIISVDGAAATDFTIIQKNKAFSARQIAIKVGDQITFVNNDNVTHNVYSETKGLEFEIELQPPGRSDTVRFSQPGIAEVQCAIHPVMKLQVRVR